MLFTPFRYPSPVGSRFRAPTDPGVWYCADEIRTTCAELGYWRWRFVQDSTGLRELAPVTHTLFQARAKGVLIDLREPPYRARRDTWTHPDDYNACQALARETREADIDIIRYESVRDPESGVCAALLRPAAFSARKPTQQQTLFLSIKSDRALWQKEGKRLEFSMARWMAPRTPRSGR